MRKDCPGRLGGLLLCLSALPMLGSATPAPPPTVCADKITNRIWSYPPSSASTDPVLPHIVFREESIANGAPDVIDYIWYQEYINLGLFEVVHNLISIELTWYDYCGSSFDDTNKPWTLRRDGIVVATGAAVPAGDPITVVDTGGFNNNPGNGLQPGTRYEYTVFESGNPDPLVNQSYCTRPANPARADWAANSDTEITVYAVPNTAYPGSGTFLFELYDDAGDLIAKQRIDAPDSSHQFTGLSNYTNYTAEVYAMEIDGCVSWRSTDYARYSDTGADRQYDGDIGYTYHGDYFAFVTPDPDVTIDADLSGSFYIKSNQSISLKMRTQPLPLTITLDDKDSTPCINISSTEASDFDGRDSPTVKIWRNGASLATADGLTVTDGVYGDCDGLSGGQKYTYKLEAIDSENSVSVFGPAVTFCALPATPRNLQALASTTTTVSLAWNPRGIVDTFEVNYTDSTQTLSKTGILPDVLSDTSGTLGQADAITAVIVAVRVCDSAYDTSTESSDSDSITLYTLPGAPTVAATNLGALADSINTIQVEVEVHADDVKSGEVTYDVYRVDGTTNTRIHAGVTAGAYFDEGLEPQKEYEYFAIAKYHGGASARSAFVVACTTPLPPASIDFEVLNHTAVFVSWSGPSEAGNGRAPDNYVVSSPDQTDEIQPENYLTTPYIYEERSTIVTFTIKSQFECSNGATHTSVTSITASGYLNPYPPSLTGVPDSTTSTDLTFIVDPINEGVDTSWLLLRDDGFVFNTPQPDETYIDTGLVPGTAYSYQAIAVQRGQNSERSAPYVVCTYPSTPRFVEVVTVDNQTINMFFTSGGGIIDGYRMSVGDSSFEEFIGADQNSYAFKLDSPGSEYELIISSYIECNGTYNLTSYQGAGAGGRVIVTGYTAPLPVNITAEPISTSVIRISFDASDSDRFHVWRDGSKLSLDGYATDVIDDTGLQAGTLYTYDVKVEKNGVLSAYAYDGVGIEAWTNPNAVYSLQVTDADAATITLGWIVPQGGIDAFQLTIEGYDTNDTTEGLNEYQFAELDSGGTVLQPDTEYTLSVRTIINVDTADAQFSTTRTIQGRTSMLPPVITVTGQGVNSNQLSIEFTSGSTPEERFLYRTDPDGTVQRVEVAIDSNVFIDSNLVLNKEYTYNATQVGLNGYESDPSDPFVFCTKPGLPRVIIMKTFDIATPSYILGWTAPSGCSLADCAYDISITGAATAEYLAVAAVEEDITANLEAAPAATFNLGVRTVFDCPLATSGATTTLSEYSNITVHTAPCQPTIQLSTISDTVIQVTPVQCVDDNNDALMDVYRFLDGVSQERTGVKVTAGEPFDDDQLTPGTEYVYTTYAFYEGRRSVVSDNSIAAAKECTNPAPVRNLDVDDQLDESVQLLWNAPSGGYTTFQYSLDSGAVDVAAARDLFVLIEDLTPATRYNIGVRSTWACPNAADTTDRTSTWVNVTTATAPSQPAVATVEPVTMTSIEVTWTTADSLGEDDPIVFRILADGLVVGEVTDELTFVHSGLLSGTENSYTVIAVKYGVPSLESDPLVGCSYPRAPARGSASATGPNEVVLNWNYPLSTASNIGVSGYDVTRTDTGAVTPDLTVREHTEGSLTAQTEYVFEIVTKIVCDAGGDNEAEYISPGVVSVTAHTAPDPPTLLIGDATPTSLTMTVDPAAYDSVRLFRFGNEVDEQTADPYVFTDSGLTPASEYRYEVSVHYFNTFAMSDVVYDCTLPSHVRNLRASTYYWYGIDVEWSRPTGGLPTSYEIMIDVDNVWEDIGYTLSYSFRNTAENPDFVMTKQTFDLTTNYTDNPLIGVVALDPASTYTVSVRAVYNCSSTDTMLQGAERTADASTTPYPAQDITLEPQDTGSIQVSWTVVNDPADITYDIRRCDYDGRTNCRVIASDLTSSPYTTTGLSAASMYCFDVLVKWNGHTVATLDRLQFVYDYTYFSGYEDYVEFTEAHLTFTNRTHGYHDALCSCTFPPTPTGLGWELTTSSSIYYYWTVPSLQSSLEQFSQLTGSFMNLTLVTSYDSDTDPVTHEWGIDSYTYEGLTDKTPYRMEVKTQLMCPDSFPSASPTIIESPVANITAWTRPTTPNITLTEQLASDMDNAVRVEYVSESTGVDFQLRRDGDLTGVEDTTLFMVNEGLTEATAYDWSVRSYCVIDPTLTIYSLWSEEVEECTLPADVVDIWKEDVGGTASVTVHWTPGSGPRLGFNYTTDTVTTAVFVTDTQVTLTNLNRCDPWSLDVWAVGDCGTQPETLSEVAANIEKFVAPDAPVITSGSDYIDDTTIGVEFTDPNDAYNCPVSPDILVWRDDVNVANVTAPGSSTYDDASLTPGTIYTYQLQAFKGGEISPLSNQFILCTPPSAVTSITCETLSPVQIEATWDGDAQYDFEVTDNFYGSPRRVATDVTLIYEIMEPGTHYPLTVTVEVVINCPRTDGTDEIFSPAYTESIDCYTWPDKVTVFRNETHIYWSHSGGSDGYRVEISPAIEDAAAGSEVDLIESTSNLILIEDYDFEAKDYSFNVTNYFNGVAAQSVIYKWNRSEDKEATLLGMPLIVGIIVIVLIILVCLVIIAILAFIVFKLVTRPRKKVDHDRSSSRASSRGSGPDVDYNINKTYDLRTEYIAERAANGQFRGPAR